MSNIRWVTVEQLRELYPDPREPLEIPYYEEPHSLMDNNERVTWRCSVCGNLVPVPPVEMPPRPCPVCGQNKWRKM